MEPSRILSGGSKLDASASHAQRPPNLPDIVSFTPFPTAPLVACASPRCLVRQHPAATATSAAPKPVCNHMLYASPSRLEQLAPGQPRFVLDVSSWIHRTSKPQLDCQHHRQSSSANHSSACRPRQAKGQASLGMDFRRCQGRRSARRAPIRARGGSAPARRAVEPLRAESECCHTHDLEVPPGFTHRATFLLSPLFIVSQAVVSQVSPSILCIRDFTQQQWPLTVRSSWLFVSNYPHRIWDASKTLQPPALSSRL